MKEEKRMWVWPEFHKKIKKKAADEDISVKELTRRMTEQLDDIELKKCPKRGGRGFDFRI